MAVTTLLLLVAGFLLFLFAGALSLMSTHYVRQAKCLERRSKKLLEESEKLLASVKGTLASARGEAEIATETLRAAKSQVEEARGLILQTASKGRLQ